TPVKIHRGWPRRPSTQCAPSAHRPAAALAPTRTQAHVEWRSVRDCVDMARAEGRPRPHYDRRTMAIPDGASGVFASQHLEQAIADGWIAGTVDETSVQPASLDLHLGPTAYRIRCSFLP